MDIIHNKRRLSTGIYSETSIFGHKTNFGKCKKFRNFRFGNKKFVGKKCNRTSPQKSNTMRFLQYTFSGTKEKRGNETSNKPSTPQQISSKTTLQNGHNVQGFKSSQKRRLGSNSRFKGCVSTCTNFPKTSQISEILCTRESLSVQSSLLWTNQRTSNFYKNNISNCSSSKEAEHKIGHIPRRLACSKSNEKYATEKSRSYSQSPHSTRFYNKQTKIKSNSNTRHNIHRGKIQVRFRESLSNTGENETLEIRNSQTFERSKFSETVFSDFRNNSILSGTDPEQSIVHETNSNTFTPAVESFKNGFGLHSSMYSRPQSSSELVVVFSKHYEGQIISPFQNISNNHYRCLSHGMGRSHEQSDDSGSLARQDENSAHKQSRTRSSIPNSKTFSTSVEKQISLGTIRQYNSSTIHQQTRGDQISTTMSGNLEIMESSIRKQYDSNSSSHSRGEQHFSRPVESFQNKINRMVIKPVSNSTNFQHVGNAIDRSICISPESESSSVLLLDKGSSSICNGCSIDFMGKHVCVCLSTPVTYTKSTSTHATMSMRANPDSTFLAPSNLVSSTVTTSNSPTGQITTSKKSANTRQDKHSSSKSRSVPVDCMAAIDEGFKAKGFSKNARKLLAQSWRSGTQKDYKSKFRKFHSWCIEREIDPYNANLENCVNFLTDLYDKGLRYRTIAGYRSMLSSVLAPIDKTLVGQHPYIIRFLKGVYNSRPPVRKLLPEWDLPLVLDMLRQPPFEPLKSSNLKYLTWKTVFLIAITTFRRCSDLQSLRIGDESVNIQQKGITFIRHGFSKQDRISHDNSKIFVPAFPKNKQLDPKKAIYYYLKRTAEFRTKDKHEETKLFLAINKPHKPVSAQTISRWIVQLIKKAYKKENRDVGTIKGHSTRSVGPSWALFKGVSMKNIMDSADWSQPTTFTKFYLKDVSVDFLNI